MEAILQELQSRGYLTEKGCFSIGRPDRATLAMSTRSGVQVVAKVYPSGGGEVTYQNMVELWRSSFGERRSLPGLPRPLDYLPDVGVLIMERLPGSPLLERDRYEPHIIDESMRLLASLHECDAHPKQQRDFRRIVRSARRKANRIVELAPKWSRFILPVADALESRKVKDRELVPSHGDFSPRNVFVGPDRLALIDWDRFQMADPARDVAYMGTWCWFSSLRKQQSPNWLVLDRVVASYSALRPDAQLEERLNFHIAAGLLRIAHSLVEFWQKDDYLVPQLAAEAFRRLE